MMKLLALIVLFLLCGSAFAYEPTDGEAKEIHAALGRWSELAANPDLIPEKERIAKLGLGVFKTSQDSIYIVGDRLGVRRELQQALIAIPGHAEYFANEIRKRRELSRAGQSNEVKGSAGWDFEALAQLPSAETVRVLGSFLDDEEGRIPADALLKTDMIPLDANNLLATRALATLGIVNPPLHKKPEFTGYDDIQPWRLWFAQVQAGNRTFRFKGDPQEYSLAGPVAEARTPQASPVARPERSQPPQYSSKAGGAEKKFPVVPLVAVGLLLASAGWLAIRKKSRDG